MSFQDYHSVKLKNMELIKKYGPKNYNFPHHVAHYRIRNFPADHRRYQFFEPPGYHRDIASGVYSPDTNKPQDIMPPDYLYVIRSNLNVALLYINCILGWRKDTSQTLANSGRENIGGNLANMRCLVVQCH